MVDNVRTDLADALRRREERLCARFADEVAALLLGNLVGEFLKRRVERILVEINVDRRCLELQRQRRPVVNRILKRILAHVSVLILLRAKRLERVVLVLVDRRSRQSEKEGIGQRLAHLEPELALLGPVRLVNHHDDVIAVIKAFLHFIELKDRRDEDLALLRLKEVHQ